MMTAPVRLLVFPTMVISFHRPNVHTIFNVRRRLARLYDNKIESTAWYTALFVVRRSNPLMIDDIG
jgi:Mg2+ and Co2+ transporter CorA